MRNNANKTLLATVFAFLVCVACASAPTEPDVGDLTDVTEPFDIQAYRDIRPEPQIRSIDLRIDIGFDEREKLPRDAISPIYTPKYVTTNGAKLIDEELVLGIEIDGDARAMPIGLLRFREIVNDEIVGVPILATW